MTFQIGADGNASASIPSLYLTYPSMRFLYSNGFIEYANLGTLHERHVNMKFRARDKEAKGNSLGPSEQNSSLRSRNNSLVRKAVSRLHIQRCSWIIYIYNAHGTSLLFARFCSEFNARLSSSKLVRYKSAATPYMYQLGRCIMMWVAHLRLRVRARTNTIKRDT